LGFEIYLGLSGFSLRSEGISGFGISPLGAASSPAFAASFALSAGTQVCPFFALHPHLPVPAPVLALLAAPQPSLVQQAAGFAAVFALVALALGAVAVAAGAAQASPFFLQEQAPPVALPQDGPWQQAAFAAAPALSSFALAAGVSAANARAALKLSAAISVGIFVFMWLVWWNKKG